MKIIKSAILIIFFSFSNVVFAQEEVSKREKLNEIRFNSLYVPFIILGDFYNIDYQRVLNQNTSLGLSFGGTSSLERKRVYQREFFRSRSLVFVSYYRRYFFNQKKIKATGLFIEPQLYFGHFDNDSNIGFGFSTGYKYLTKNNFVWEILLGGGVYLDGINGYPRTGILFGKRF